MLGIIHDIWDKTKSVPVKEGDQFVVLQGKRLEVKIEEGKQLRLSLVEEVDDRDERHHEALSARTNLLKSRRTDLTLNNEELNVIIGKLDGEELDEVVEEDLESQARDKRRIKRLHAKEIRKVESQTTVIVEYRSVKTGYSSVLPPGLMSQPQFLSEPVCWCPLDIPEPVEETSTKVENMPVNVTSAPNTTAAGDGLSKCMSTEKSKFIITAMGFDGEHRHVGGDKYAVECKETEIQSLIRDKNNGKYEVSYSAGDLKGLDEISLGVSLRGLHISGSPFAVECRCLLLEFSSKVNHKKDWLDEAVREMSTIPRARLWVHLYDANGSEVYQSTGVTTTKWTPDYITAPQKVQHYDNKHTNVIRLDNGDGMMITGKANSDCPLLNAYLPYNIIINAGWNQSMLSTYKHPRRMIIATCAPNVPGWKAADNRISFSSAGFSTMATGWPKFNGKFRIYYKPL